MRKIVSAFLLIVGGFAAAGWANGISKTGGIVWIAAGLVVGLWKFVRGALAEGKVAEAEAVLRYQQKAVSAPVRTLPQYLPVQIEVIQVEPEVKKNPSAVEVEKVTLSAPEETEVDYDPFCRYADNLEKEKERLERVLWGLYNKRDKWEYMGKSKTSQAWRGLEWDINEIERRLEALAEI